VRIAFEEGRWEDVRQLIEPRLAHPGVVLHIAHGLLGIACAMQGDSARAEIHLERALELGSTEPDVLGRLGLLIRRRAPERALELTSKAFDASGRHDFALLAGLILATDLHRPREALAWFERASTSDSTAAEALVAGLECSLQCQSPTIPRLAERIAESNLTASELVRVVIALASRPDVPAAFDRIIDRLGPRADEPDLVVLRVEQALARGRGLQALKLARGLYRAHPLNDEARLALAAVLCRLGEDLDEAERLVGPYRSTSTPAEAELVHELGRALAARGQYARALAILSPLGEALPELVELQVLLAQLHHLSGNPTLANRFFLAAVARDPNIDEASATLSHELDARLSRLRETLAETPLSSSTVVALHRGHNSLVLGLANSVEAAASRKPEVFIKLYPPESRTRTQVSMEFDLLARLATSPDARPATPRPFAPSLGLIDLDGWHGFVMTAVNGARLAPHELYASTLPEPRAAALGEALARLQRRFEDLLDSAWNRPLESGVSSSLAPVLAWARGETTFKRELERLGLADMPRVEDLEARLASLEPDFASLAETELPRGIIHGDFAAHNVLWDAQGIASVVDFDYATRDHWATDLAACLGRCAFDWDRLNRTGDPSFNRAAAASLIASYGRTRASLGMAPWPLADLGDLTLVLIGVRITYNLALASVAAKASDDLTRSRLGTPEGALTNLLRQLDWLMARRDLLGT
jgi:Ser/Thr protein kinase RdoA (MazF antagonist)/Flp pilus assembly protein TadD